MSKKIYIQPEMAVTALAPFGQVMLNISSGGTPPDEGAAHAPGRRGTVIP